MMAGLLRPSAGTVSVDGIAPAGNPDIYRTIALVPEGERFSPSSLADQFVHMSARLQQLPDAAAAARRAIALVDL